MDKKFHSFSPEDHEVSYVHRFMLGGVAPRPIAFVSTTDGSGNDNLAPYSFFNAFGANPPYVAFSPARRGRDNTTKDTYHNLLETKECVIHTVTHSIVEQMNLASCEYPSGVDEFVKAGFTKVKSDIVKAPRVLESPFHMECVLDQMIELGGKAGSGNLAVCRVVKFHTDESIMSNGMLDPTLLDSVGRNGGEFYTRANGDSLFQIAKPNRETGVGFDNIPDEVKSSELITGNELARLAMESAIPTLAEAKSRLQRYFQEKHESVEELSEFLNSSDEAISNKQLFFDIIKKALRHGDTQLAWDLIVLQENEN